MCVLNKKYNSIKQTLLVLLVIILTMTGNTLSYAMTASDVSDIACGIVAYEGDDCSDVSYIFDMLTDGRNYDYSNYVSNMSGYIEENMNSASKVTLLKYALYLSFADPSNILIKDVYDTCTGELGIMSYVYGLLVATANYPYDAKDIITTILSLKHEDGGFSINGNYADVDVTAMTLQALAPFYLAIQEDSALSNYLSDDLCEEIVETVDVALTLLSNKQLDNGGFSSYGTENPESASQVVIALSALKIDVLTDERFIKNGNTVFDAINEYRLADGSFCHTLSGESNELATIQAFTACVSYNQRDKGSIYDVNNYEGNEYYSVLETTKTDIKETSETDISETETTATEISENVSDDKSSFSDIIKPLLYVFIILLAMVLMIILTIKKKRHPLSYLSVILIAAILCVAVYNIKISTKSEYYSKASEKSDICGYVTISVMCETVDDPNNSYIPDDGIIIDNEFVTIENGDTVYDILVEVCKNHEILLDIKGISTGNTSSAYIAAIGGIYEMEYGELSGWMYFVNGESGNVSCGSYILSDGDEITWQYTTNMGGDLQ